MDALLDLASCMAYTLAKTLIWGINHVVMVLIQICLFALDLLDFSVTVGWMALDGVALLFDAGYDAITMGTSAAPTIAAALYITLSSQKELAALVRKFPKKATVYALYVVFLTIDIVENFFTIVALIFEAIVITRAMSLAIQIITSWSSSAIVPARSAKWRRKAKRNVLALRFPILLESYGLVALFSAIGALLTERRIAVGVFGSEPLAFGNLTGTLLGSDGFNF